MTMPSKRQVDIAGTALRDWWAAPREAELPEQAALVLFAFREEFQDPMKKVTVGVRQFVKREIPEGARITVGQRLKRAPQIVAKLGRHPKMNLSRMQDIAGCRAILTSGTEVEAVARRIRRNWLVKHEKHYTLAEPAPSGYRAHHMIVERDGRLVEIQLRTLRQHEWAEAVERTDKRLRMDLKSGSGPADLLEYFRLAAHGLALEEAAIDPDETFMRDFNQAREQARRYFT